MTDEHDVTFDALELEVGSLTKKTRITIRLDDDVIHWFKEQVDTSGGGNYQTLINRALREYIQQQDESLEDTLRRVLREELIGEDPSLEETGDARLPNLESATPDFEQSGEDEDQD